MRPPSAAGLGTPPTGFQFGLAQLHTIWYGTTSERTERHTSSCGGIVAAAQGQLTLERQIALCQSGLPRDTRAGEKLQIGRRATASATSLLQTNCWKHLNCLKCSGWAAWEIECAHIALRIWNVLTLWGQPSS